MNMISPSSDGAQGAGGSALEAVVDVRGHQVAVSVVGRGSPTLVWAHGILADRAADDEVGMIGWGQLAEGSRVIRYDAPGHGASALPEDPGELSWATQGQYLLGVASLLGARLLVAGGASMGCAAALHAAVAAPDRVRALVLAMPPTAWESRPAQVESYSSAVALLDRRPEQAARLLRVGSPSPFGSLVSPGFPDAEAILRRHRQRLGPERIRAIFAGAVLSDLPPPEEVARLAVPTLILAWGGDPGHPLATAERLHELIPRSELEVAADAADVAGWTGSIGRFLRTADHAP